MVTAARRGQKKKKSSQLELRKRKDLSLHFIESEDLMLSCFYTFFPSITVVYLYCMHVSGGEKGKAESLNSCCNLWLLFLLLERVKLAQEGTRERNISQSII